MSNFIEPRVRYEPKPLPLPHSTQRMKFHALAGDTSGGATSRILVDNLQNSMLATDECYLNFSVQGNIDCLDVNASSDAQTIYLNHNGATNCIRKLEVIHSGNSILTCDNFNMVASVLNVASVSYDANNVGVVTNGASLNITDVQDPTIQQQTTGATLKGMSMDYFGSMISGSDANSAKTPIISFSVPILGMLSSCLKHIPLDWLSSSLEIQITWENDARKVFNSLDSSAPVKSSSTIKVLDINLDTRINTYEQASMDIINKVNGWEKGKDPVNWCGFQYKVSLATITKAQQDASSKLETLIPNSRYKSLQSIIYASFPTNGTASGGTEIGYGASHWLPFIGVSSQQYRLGSHLIPQQKLNTIQKANMETIGCFSAIDKSLACSMMTKTTTSMNERQPSPVTNDNVVPNRGAIGVDVSTFGDSNQLVSGYNTTNLSVSSLQETTASTATFAQQVCYVSKIMVLYQMNPENGRISCSF